ncbi:MAG: sirohydrochlorin chelatase [Gammaproteobacteria bacterium]
MKALLLIAHGSRRQQSNDEVKVIAEKLHHHCADQYPIVEAGFLELGEPLIPDGIKRCVERGATSVIVLPYFLNSGTHVVTDVPEIVNETQKHYPEVDIKVSKHLGASDLMMDLLISSANSVN